MSTSTRGFASMSEERRREVSRQAGMAKNKNKGFGSLSPEERSKNASMASKKRWAKVKQLREERNVYGDKNTETEGASSTSE